MAKILSVEIDNTCIKIMEASRKTNGELLSINKSLSINIPDNCIVYGKIINLDYISSEIKNACVNSNIKTKKVIFVISPGLVIMRKIKLPVLKRKSQNASMVKLEFEQSIATNLSQIVIYRKTDKISYDEDTSITEFRYIVYGLSCNIYNQYIELSKMLKLNPIALITSSNCLEKISEKSLIVNQNINFKGTSAFIKILYNYIVFCVIKNNVDDFSRIIDLNTNNNNFYEPDRVAESQDDFNYKANDNKEETDVDINMYIDEINKNIRYYNSMDIDNEIEKIYIYGDSKDSKIDVFKDYLISSTNKDVEIIKDIKKINENNNLNMNYTKNEFDKIKYLHGFLSLFTNSNDINFLTDTIKKHKKKLIVYILVITTLFSALIIVFFYSKKNMIKNEQYKDELILMNLFINERNNMGINNKAEIAKNEIAILENYKKESLEFKTIIDDKNIVSSEILREIQNIIPSNTEIASIIMGKDNIQMQCRSINIEEIILFLDNIRGVNSVTSVYIPLIKYNVINDYNFSYSVICKFGDVDFNEIK